MNIAYLVWLEDLVSPIIRGQVIELLQEIVSQRPDLRVHAFLFQPVHRLILRSQAIKVACSDLRTGGIRPVVIPCLVPPRIEHFRARWYVMPFILLHSFPALLILTLFHRIDILHCRSYPATWAALGVKKLTGTTVVFDPRSDFPEENLTAGLWTKDSLTHRAWKYIERRLLAESDVTIAILETYVTHFREICPGASFEVIPNNVDTERFKRDEARRKAFRQEMGVTDDTVVFAYSGSLGTHWHNPDLYAGIIPGLRDLSVAHRFLFVTPERELLESTLRNRGVRPEEYTVVSSDFEDVPIYLSAADFGLMFLKDYKIAMGIKTVEYLAMGLPVITDTNTAGAKEIIDRHGAGLVVENRDQPDLKAIEALIQKKDDVAAVSRRTATALFSTTRVAAQYARLYGWLKTSGNGKSRTGDQV